MEYNAKKEGMPVDPAEIYSPNWNETYIDGAFLTADDYYSVRVAFINHVPKNYVAEKTVNICRKVDVVMSQKAFFELCAAFNDLKEKIEASNKTEQLNPKD